MDGLEGFTDCLPGAKNGMMVTELRALPTMTHAGNPPGQQRRLRLPDEPRYGHQQRHRTDNPLTAQLWIPCVTVQK